MEVSLWATCVSLGPVSAEATVFESEEGAGAALTAAAKQARAAAQLIHVDYERSEGAFDLESAKNSAVVPKPGFWGPSETAVGDFAGAFAAAPVTLSVSPWLMTVGPIGPEKSMIAFPPATVLMATAKPV